MSQTVLVLNNSYQPLQVLALRKALRLIFKGRAEIVQYVPDQFYRSINSEIQLPSVIRVFQYVQINKKPVPYSRKNVLIRDNFTCQYCGTTTGKMTIDHIIPTSKGGKDTWTNVVASCVKCNVSKSDKYLHQTDFVLLSKPKEPTFFHQLQKHHKIREDWKPYLFK